MLSPTHHPMQKKSPRGVSTEGVFSPSQYIRRMSLRHHLGFTVIQMWEMAPEQPISARTAVSPLATVMHGRTFHPRPSSRAAESGPGSSLAPPPGLPSGFSALIERERASESRARFPRPMSSPSNM